MSSRLRFIVSTSPGAWVAMLLMIGTVSYLLAERFPLWRGDWWWGYHQMAQALPVVMIIVALTVGWNSGSAATGHATVTARGPDSMSKIVATYLVVPMGTAWSTGVLGIGCLVIITLGNEGTIDHRALLMIAGHSAMILLAATTALVAGALVAAPYSALVAAATVSAALFVSVPSSENLFSITGPAQAVVGMTATYRPMMVVLTTCLAASIALVWVATRRQRRRLHDLLGVAVAVSIVVAGSMALPSEKFAATGQPPAECVTDTIDVCFYPGYVRLLDPATRQLEDLRSRAIAQGVAADDLSATFHQFGGVPPERGTAAVQLDNDSLRHNALSARVAALAFSDPLWCDSMFADTPPLGLLEHRDAVYDWFLWLQGALPLSELIDRNPQFTRGTDAERASVVTHELRQLSDCAP